MVKRLSTASEFLIRVWDSSQVMLKETVLERQQGISADQTEDLRLAWYVFAPVRFSTKPSIVLI